MEDMMKKLLAIALALVMIFALAACGGNDAPAPAPAAPAPADPAPADPAPADPAPADPADEGFRLALITDYGTIDDGSFNQGSWEGLVWYAEENGISHQYIQPAEVSDAAYIDAIELAIIGGAELIVTPGFLFASPIYEAQGLFPDTKFVLIDSVPDGPSGIADNTVSVLYAEQQSGFLAGYAAVMDGHRQLGFVGGIAVPPVVLFGTGFVEGADYAAQELGLSPGDVSVMYHYAGTFSPSADAQSMAASWYNDGVEVIFTAAGGVNFSVFAAAEAAGGLTIGVDSDQSWISETIITSALKGLQASVYSVISDYMAGNFPGGQIKVFDAAVDGVGLPMETSRFQQFTQAQYDEIFAKLVAGSIPISTEIGNTAHEGLSLNIVEVISIG